MTPHEEYMQLTAFDPPKPCWVLKGDGRVSAVALNMDWPKIRVREDGTGTTYWTDITWVSPK